MSDRHDPTRPTLAALLWAAFWQRCPRCLDGRMFRGQFAMNDPCPKCGLPFLLQKVSKTGTRVYCNDKEGCGYTMDAGEVGEEAPPEGGDAPPKSAA